MGSRSEGDDITEIRRAIRQQHAKLMANVLKNEMRSLSGHWEAIQEAHDHTTEATALRDAGMARDFYLIALQDMARVKEEADESIRELVNLLVQDLNVASTTVAGMAGVSHTTVSRWLDPNRETIGRLTD